MAEIQREGLSSPMSSEIHWFSDSPDAGDPACLCSACSKIITEEDAPAIRVFDEKTEREARFHMECALSYLHHDGRMMMSLVQRTERTRKLQRWLMDQGIRSMGPQTAMCLLDIEREVREKLPTAEDPEVKAWAERYADALNEVCIVLSLHQAAAIARFSALIEGIRGTEERTKTEDGD